MTSKEIRQQFIDFFVQRHGHSFVPSSPVVPHDDPTLLFTNAGMNQFKPYFLGTEKAPWRRVANTQKCIRAGGKHNDLDDVGRSRRHHTFFEMLGNWSFGDYFKQGAIEMSWELLTKVWKLDPTRLHVSCFEGDQKNGVPRDTEAADIWRKVANWEQYGLRSEGHIHYFGKDNFWEMGDTGPCGPCTEIYIDRRPKEEIEADRKAGRRSPVNGEDPRVMEIWNNVFIQYNREYTDKGRQLLAESKQVADPEDRRRLQEMALASRDLITLPSQHVDTGMGFERITQVLQNVNSNYEIDLFNPFWDALKKLSGRTYTGKYPKSNAADPAAEAADEQLRTDIAFRVIADHVRCLTFALTDGATPSNEGRGYVLRRILRRAVRFGRQQLDLREPFLHSLVPIVIDAMGDAFPELKKSPQHVVELIKDEEIGFGRTLDRGIALFEEAASRSGGKDIPAGDAFKLHDTYGFPIDLTRIMAEERGMSVDIDGYEKLMEQARELARSGGKQNDTRLFELSPDALAKLQKEGVAATDDSAKYNAAPIGATVNAIWDGASLIAETHGAQAAAQDVAIILDKTNFYAEMGGQVGDIGELRSTGGAVMDVTTARVAGAYVLHVGRMVQGHLRVGDHVTATLAGMRPRTEKNHTTTHLANWALRETLGEGVQQKGSLVDPEKLRFDFSHGKSLTDDELSRVESLVGQCIERKLPVYAENAPQEQALKINGLRAVFGEKYPPMVRVVSIGVPVGDLLKDPTNAKWREYSIEFCGGTHLKSSVEAEGFVITAEESVSKGIRRIVGLTGEQARQSQQIARELDTLLERAKGVPEAQLREPMDQIQKLLAQPSIPLRAKRRGQATVTELQGKLRAYEKAQQKAAGAGGGKLDVAQVATDLLSNAGDVGGGKLVVATVSGASSENLLSILDSLRKRQPTLAVMLGSADEAKASFVSAVSDDLIAKGLKAGDWIRETAKVAGGGGGGRPNMAQAGGKDPSKLGDALAKAKEYAQSVVK